MEQSRKKQSLYTCCRSDPNWARAAKGGKKSLELGSFVKEQINSYALSLLDVNYLEEVYLKEERRKEDEGEDDRDNAGTTIAETFATSADLSPIEIQEPPPRPPPEVRTLSKASQIWAVCVMRFNP